MRECEKETINCHECEAKYKIPHEFCCLYECGEHEFCGGCNKGIYLNEDKENK